ncbi:MAG TPA: ATP-binding protein, partial [Pseudosphingobacterium sp.]|nr:ATP-binding protein [Pseudosphingobacterium sp.]
KPYTPPKDLNYDKALSFFNKDNDSAFYYFNKTATTSKDSLTVAMAYSYMAMVQADAGDYFGSIESSLMVLALLDEKNQMHFGILSSNYNELGLNSYHLNHYDEALNYYDLALKYSQDNEYRLIVLNNKALAYREKKDYASSIKMYNEIIAKKKLSKKEYARALTNLSFAKWLQNSTYKAGADLLTALHIREEENDLWGQNSSYAHLTEYYSEKNADSALFYAHKRFIISKKIDSPDDQLQALQKLIKLSPADSTKQYFETYEQLSDSLQLARGAAKNQFALIRYETEKHKADNLKLQQDNAEKKYQIIKQRVILIGIVLLMISGIIISYLWYKKRKQRLALEAQNSIKESQLRTSRKVHDVVANGLYRVMTEIENQSDIDREGILDRLEHMYEKSRDISYEAEELPTERQNFHEKIADLLRSFATESTKVIIAGNAANLWESLNEPARYEIEHILQELMVNMKKHSHASNVVVKFEERNNDIHIYYADNGIGVKEGFQQHNGLTNTGNRIKSLQGEIIFDTEVEKGLKIHISFPNS